MRNRYSLMYPWTVARIRARSRLFEPGSRYWRGFPLVAMSVHESPPRRKEGHQLGALRYVRRSGGLSIAPLRRRRHFRPALRQSGALPKGTPE